MRYLHVLRHAKSSWDDPGLEDHERPLAPRGRKAGKRLAKHLRREGIQPELVLCSSSRRTRETLELIRSVLGDAVAVGPGSVAALVDGMGVPVWTEVHATTTRASEARTAAFRARCMRGNLPIRCDGCMTP